MNTEDPTALLISFDFIALWSYGLEKMLSHLKDGLMEMLSVTIENRKVQWKCLEIKVKSSEKLRELAKNTNKQETKDTKKQR